MIKAIYIHKGYFWVVFLAVMAVVSGAAAWFYFIADVPRKAPLRAKQVWQIQFEKENNPLAKIGHVFKA